MSRTSSRGTLLALGAFAGVAGLQSFGVSIFTPQIATSLKVTAVSLLSVRVPAIAVELLLPLAMPLLSDGRRLTVRVWTPRICALLAALVLALTGQVSGSWALVGVLSLGALFASPGRALNGSLAVAEADETFRLRALSVVPLGLLLGQAALTLGVLATTASWGGVLTAAGVIAVVVVPVGMFVHRPAEVNAVVPPPRDEVPNWGELGRAWRATPSLLGAGIALAATGLLLMPYDAVLAIYLRQHFQLQINGVSAVFLAMAWVGIVAVALSSSYGDRLLATRPARLAQLSAIALGVASTLLLIGALAPGRAAATVLVAVGAGVGNALVPTLVGLGMALTPRTQRTALSAAAAALLALGSLVGVIVAVCVADRYGVRYALVALAGVGVLAAAWWQYAARSLQVDLQRADLSQRKAEARSEGAASSGNGSPTPSSLLVCEGVDFSYGSLQVLFGVDAHVDDGEIVGLLGTNGAGKSTLLRVISGLGIPERGSVSFAGRDITYLDAEARVRLGITQVPGGKAVFRSMNVIENLQSFGYTLGRDRRAVDEAIERCLEAFPRLRERKSSSAAMLSGGEQQMVALSKALILRPKVLLIDELSLGLAPVIVNRLLDMVRRINADGTAVVIVEQSVTTALSLVHRAYFMEKGEVRFDGPAADLIDRHDLLRAVFLEGAAKGVVT
ncbi:MAG TPA: ATP-binding cassette domain-containing protein [Mycobacteriales bacterium]|nr:ATP-binding cassette domain-containing protein [Mycobacteriales bacterium]